MLVIDYDGRKSVFIHIPKTGGSSLRLAFLAVKAQNGKLTAAHQLQRRQTYITRILPMFLKSLLVQILQTTPFRYLITTAGHPTAAYINLFWRYRPYWKFSFVRNPIDRVISSYNFRISQGYTESFDEFFENVHLHVQPQVNYLSWRGRIIVDFVGKVENFDEDYNKVCSILGIDAQTVPYFNKSDRIIGRELLTEEMRVRLFKLYEEDFKVFHYSSVL
jgi:hypothetical protein